MKKDNSYLFASILFFVIGIIIIVASIRYHLNKTHIGLVFALPPLVHLALGKQSEVDVRGDKMSEVLFKLLVSLFFVLISLSLWIWQSEAYYRPISFFIIVIYRRKK